MCRAWLVPVLAGALTLALLVQLYFPSLAIINRKREYSILHFTLWPKYLFKSLWRPKRYLKAKGVRFWHISSRLDYALIPLFAAFLFVYWRCGG